MYRILKRKYFFLLACMAIAGSINAQVRPGVKVGYNLSGVLAKLPDNVIKSPNVTGNPDNFHIRSGFQGGLIADCPISATLAIQPGARFAMQGFTEKYRRGAPSGPEVIRRFSLYYLQVPVYAQYRWNVYEETNVLFQAGPYAGFGLFGRQSYSSGGETPKGFSDKHKKIDFKEDFNNIFDYGVSAGIGIEFIRFQLVAAYDFGLNQATFYKKEAYSGNMNVNMRNHNFSITLAVIFGRRDPLQNQKD